MPALCIAVALAAVCVSCKGIAPKRAVSAPSQDSLRAAARACLVESGLKEIEAGKFERRDAQGSKEIFVLEHNPAHIIEVPSDEYPFQGIMIRKKVGAPEDSATFFVIMWWSRAQDKWVHLTGDNIPEIEYEALK